MRSKFGAVVLIVVGTLFLITNLGIFPAAELKALLAKWWPLILIFIGVWNLVRK
jgi:hypothetical protein